MQLSAKKKDVFILDVWHGSEYASENTMYPWTQNPGRLLNVLCTFIYILCPGGNFFPKS